MKKTLHFLFSIQFLFVFSQDQKFPLDPFFSLQWGMNNLGQIPFLEDTELKFSKYDADIDMPEAWSIETGSPDVTLAVIDEWIDIEHLEFKDRIWSNPNEVPNNGIDDDNNGFVDDFYGANINEMNGNIQRPPYLDVLDFLGVNHGTTVASVAMANANNLIGIAGVDWNCKMMPITLKPKAFADPDTDPELFKIKFEENLAIAIRYAADNGADVILFAEGLPNDATDRPVLVEKAIEYAEEKGTLIVVSMGNFGSTKIRYPGYFSLTHNNVIAVGASNPDDTMVKRFWFANFITEAILPDFIQEEIGTAYGDYMDVIAPGNFAVVMNVQFDLVPYILAGTSYAAPLVAGIATLLKAQNPNRTPAEIKHIIRHSAEDQVGDPILDTPGFDIYHGWGRVNAYNALTYTLPTNTNTPKVAESNLLLFPNPAQSEIYLDLANLQMGTEYSVFNSSGGIVMQGVVSPTSKNVLEINLSALATGVYWIRTTNANGKLVSKQFQVN